MHSLKLVSFSAACGFILSLICGFFSKSSFVKIFFIALLWALIFAAMAFLIYLVYSKFLDVATDGEVVVNSTTVDLNDNKPAVGQNVDLIIQDQELERSQSLNHYDVGDNHQMLTDDDIKKKSIREQNSISIDNDFSSHNSVQNESQSFVPVRNLETVTNVSGTESKKYDEIQSVSSNEDEQIDTLPDMGNMGFSSSQEDIPFASSKGGDSINYDDSFSESSFGTEKKDVSADEVQDASLMAKAISSILSEET